MCGLGLKLGPVQVQQALLSTESSLQCLTLHLELEAWMLGLQPCTVTSAFSQQTFSSQETVKVMARCFSYGAYIKQRKQKSQQTNKSHTFRDQKWYEKTKNKAAEWSQKERTTEDCDLGMGLQGGGDIHRLTCKWQVKTHYTSTWPQNVLEGWILEFRRPAGISLVHLKKEGKLKWL